LTETHIGRGPVPRPMFLDSIRSRRNRLQSAAGRRCADQGARQRNPRRRALRSHGWKQKLFASLCKRPPAKADGFRLWL